MPTKAGAEARAAFIELDNKGNVKEATVLPAGDVPDRTVIVVGGPPGCSGILYRTLTALTAKRHLFQKETKPPSSRK